MTPVCAPFTPNPKVAYFCAALWSGFTPPLTTCRVIDKLAPSHTKTKGAARVAEVERAQRAFLLPAAE